MNLGSAKNRPEALSQSGKHEVELKQLGFCLPLPMTHRELLNEAPSDVIKAIDGSTCPK